MNAYLKKKTTIRERKQKLVRFMVSATFRMGLVVFIVLFGFLYIWQTNSISTKGYELSDLEQQIKQLERENRKLDVHVAEYSSMQNIQERLGGMNLVSADNIEYVTLVGTAVAQR
ncbi:MAG: hypothetical protein COU33_03360 [Candidatus Magasanikbacteria bacterium CG10_big_fil_rev_8_21_14_0_10_43_6]|uniref:Cell division protein FtsL n=1 Tax=Candidatus Magasanikbacteria bacterium CG10_big_fil_rev_8_21_14_0_10_43_6 TaxID=1974650 RepID=A0A2M6W102_9BACT|nr:MAG: hypothetical protein COU33_03360 [Candidatus Magasanikbacteria bacterium CG10_big_fil_rev_8_21_14_0_10_43_6]